MEVSSKFMSEKYKVGWVAFYLLSTGCNTPAILCFIINVLSQSPSKVISCSC